jgi:hypothetical protein
MSRMLERGAKGMSYSMKRTMCRAAKIEPIRGAIVVREFLQTRNPTEARKNFQ